MFEKSVFLTSSLLFLLISLLSCSAQQVEKPVGLRIHSFDECVAAGFAIMKSAPARCIGPDGTIFVQELAKESQLVPSGKSGKLCVDHCGDGKCQEIVCMAQGCPCSETPQKCPSDCKIN